MPPEAAPFLNWGIALCAVMAGVWAVRIRARGVRAVPMLLAFLCLGLLMVLLRERAPEWSLVATGIGLFVLLVADALVRSAHAAAERGE
jgi:hypothetical protein